MTKAEWAALEKKLRFRAFTVAKLGTAEEIDKAKQVLIKSLENGESYAESWEALKQKVNTNALGIKPGYWETVFRTNTQSAYMAGKLQKYEGTGAVAYQLLVIEDERTSKICRHLLVESGYGAILPVGHRFWQKYGFPPYHFNCRTSVNPIYSSQVAKTGYIVEDIPMNRFAKFKPQKGFGGNPLDRGSWWNMTDSMKKQAVKFGLIEIIKKGQVSIFKSELQEIENLIPSLSNGFVGAKNIKEANEYAEKVLGIPHADYKGVSLEAANEWNKGLYENFQKFPELKERFGFVGECHARNAAMKARYFELNRTSALEGLRKINPGIKDELLEPYVPKVLEKRWQRDYGKYLKVPKDAIANSFFRSGDWLEEFNGIALNRDTAKDFSVFIKNKELAVKAKLFPEGTASVKGTIDHEIAHQLDKMLDIRKDKVIMKLHKDLTNREITDGLSEYAWHNNNPEPIGEFIAEAWSEYCNNPNPRPIAETVGKRIEEMYKTWKK
ncbi:MAG: minor capsid protein [Spirochaetales bacterium]|nr:minor capsid protein [Spirochaetales bacterium]